MVRLQQILLCLLMACFGFGSVHGQIHPKEALGRKIFDSFRQNKFSDFYLRSIFSLEEEQFRSLIYGVENYGIRETLFNFHTHEFPLSAQTPEARWRIAFAHTWRNQWRHIAYHSPQMVQREAFDPIINEAKEYGILWKATDLIAIEALLPVHWERDQFEVKRDSMNDLNATDPRTLFFDRKLTYRLKLDKSTYGKAFMIGYSEEDSEKAYHENILGNGSGQADMLFRFENPFPDQLYYFCPDEPLAGGPILIKDYDDLTKPNQRTDILLTFSYGVPQRAYQILIRDVLSTPWGEVFCERPQWLGEVLLPRGLNFPD